MSEPTKKKQRIYRHSKKEQQLLKRLVAEWDDTYGTGITFKSFCEKKGIPITTLRPYCCRDKSERLPLSNGDYAKPHYNALIPPDRLENFVRDFRHLERPQMIQELMTTFELNGKQASNQFDKHIRPMLDRLKMELEEEEVQDTFKNKAADTIAANSTNKIDEEVSTALTYSSAESIATATTANPDSHPSSTRTRSKRGLQQCRNSDDRNTAYQTAMEASLPSIHTRSKDIATKVQDKQQLNGKIDGSNVVTSMGGTFSSPSMHTRSKCKTNIRSILDGFEEDSMQLGLDCYDQPMELDNGDQQLLDKLSGDSYVGHKVAKYFDKYDEIYHGIVSEFDHVNGWWKISYDDDDREDFDFNELKQAMNLQSALNSNDSTAFRQVAKAVIRYLNSFDHDTNDWGALLQTAQSCKGEFHLNNPANPSKEVWYSFHIDRIFALCKQCGQSAACATGEEIFTIDRFIALEAIFAMTLNPSPFGWWDGITHGLERCRENGRNLILNFIEYMVETHGTVSRGPGHRHAPSHGKQMSQQKLFLSLLNLSNIFHEASDGSTTKSSQQLLMRALDKGGCYGVGDLTAGEISHVATAVGLVTKTSDTKTLNIAKTTKTFSRLAQHGIRSDEECRKLQHFIGTIFDTTDLSLVENWLCEALRLDSGSRLGVDTLLKKQQYLYKINDRGVLMRIDIKGNEHPAPRINFDDSSEACAKLFCNGISWWDGNVGDNNIAITLSTRKKYAENNVRNETDCSCRPDTVSSLDYDEETVCNESECPSTL